MEEDEVVLRRRRPHLPNAVVRSRDPRVLACRNRLALARSRESRALDHDRGGAALTAFGRLARSAPAELSPAQLLPDRRHHASPVGSGVGLHTLDSDLAPTRVGTVPTEDLVGQEVEILVHPEAALPEELVERNPV